MTYMENQFMFFTGFADEAAVSLDGQIEATLKLGWKFIESRSIDNVNIHDLPEEQFEIACGKLADAGISVNCFGSTVANWQRPVFDEAGWELSREQLKRALVRMQKLNCKIIRGMSFLGAYERPTAFDPEVEAWVFPRVCELVKMCADAGVMYGHENCRNYGGMSYKHTLKLIEAVNNPNFTLIYDIGNPVFNVDYSSGKSEGKHQNSWEFYSNVKEFISYVHIKDGRIEFDEKGEKKEIFTFPGEGNAFVKEIVTDLIANGYDGGFSIEPHMGAVFHDANAVSSDEYRFNNYVEYGRRFEKMVADIKNKLGK